MADRKVADRAGVVLRIMGSRVRAQVQYRGSFAMEIAGSAGVSVLDLVTILVVFHQIPRLNGWTFPEVALLFGISYLPFRLADMTIGQIETLPTMIREGRLDGLLTRPLGLLLQISTQEFHLRWFGGVAQGFVVLFLAVALLNIQWTVLKIAFLVVTLVSAYVIFLCIWVAMNSITFWVIGAREVANAFTYGGREVTMFPLEIFGKWLRQMVIFIVPLAFVAYFPALYILDRDDPFGAPAILNMASPLVAAISVLASRAIWRFAVRHYRSTGS